MMINNFDDYDAGRMEDLSFDRQAYMGGPPAPIKPTSSPFILLSELQDAFIGVVEGADTRPRACYSVPMVKTILSNKHNLTEEVARDATEALIKTYLGPSTPCFLDTSALADG